jgi:hypothetical protein
MKGVSLGLRFIAWLGLKGKPHKIPLDMGPGHLTNFVNVMFNTTHGFVLGPWKSEEITHPQWSSMMKAW